MDEGKFAADFIAKNIEKICAIGKSSYGKIDALIQIKLKTAYTEYLDTSSEKHSKSKSFFIRNESVDLYSYYVPTGITCGNTNISNPSFSECVNYSKRMVITGSGGSGKTVLIKHLFLDCIKDKRYAPVLIELRDLNTNKEKKLNNLILSTLEIYGFNISNDYIKRAMKAGHFCFFLDGYDEVNHSLRKKLTTQIKTLSNKFPNCPIFISSRPDNTFNGIDDFCIFNIQPLDLTSAKTLIEKLPYDQCIKTKFTTDLSNSLFEQHESFLSNPLLLSIMLLTYGENAEIPSKQSVFYNQAFEALFHRHDAYKGGYYRDRLTNLDIQDFARIFSLFSLQTYEKGIFRMPRIDCLNFIEKSRDSWQKDFATEDYLNDLLNAACLLLEDGLEIAFSHRSFQEYFVALHISNSQPETQEKLIQRYWGNISSDNVIPLLIEINPELIERLLIIPQLERLFNSIGIRKKVGITHAAKYFKTIYKSLRIAPFEISAHYNEDQIKINSLLRLTMKCYSTHQLPDDDYFDENRQEMIEKYGIKKFTTSELTFKTAIFKDIAEGQSVFSIKYLQAAFDAYTKLKLKHQNQNKNLNDLLGIN